MHIYHLDRWKHSHRYVMEDGHGERNTRRVIFLTLSMMIIEISAGYLFGSMALLADGWHMGTHAVALGITAFAYYSARRKSDDPDYSFGTGKILLDRDVNQEAVDEIRAKLEADSDTRVTDIHVWRVGSHHLSAIISLVTHYPKSPDYYKKMLLYFDEIVHVTIEVNKCEGEPCLEVAS